MCLHMLTACLPFVSCYSPVAYILACWRMHGAFGMIIITCCGMQDVPELQGAAQLGTQLPASASGGSLALPAGINPEDIAEGSIRFFHDDLCLSIPFKGEHFMSIDAIKALTPRELILLYEASPISISLAFTLFTCRSSALVLPRCLARH